jgi:pyrroloquinoline quinone biosynthesis protein D
MSADPTAAPASSPSETQAGAAPTHGFTRPKLPRGVRLRYDEVRSTWMMLAPERAFRIDETAAEILKLCDGSRDFAQIVGAIAEKYAEDPNTIAADIAEMLKDLVAKRVLEP